jgi:hypothetical protein
MVVSRAGLLFNLEVAAAADEFELCQIENIY